MPKRVIADCLELENVESFKNFKKGNDDDPNRNAFLSDEELMVNKMFNNYSIYIFFRKRLKCSTKR
jgi:hypothetical protein